MKSARRALAPSSRADWTYSESPTESTSPRTTRAYEGHETTTIASAALREPAAEHGGDHHREDDRREREDEVGAAHRDAVERAAEVARDRADRAADRSRRAATRKSAIGSVTRAP